jgi:hypothetical protein
MNSVLLMLFFPKDRIGDKRMKGQGWRHEKRAAEEAARPWIIHSKMQLFRKAM